MLEVDTMMQVQMRKFARILSVYTKKITGLRALPRSAAYPLVTAVCLHI